MTDMGSFNGTKVNGKSIQNIRLKNNDEVKIGKIMLKFSTGEKPAQSPVQTVVLTKGNDKRKFKIKKVGPKKVKGRAAEILVFEVLG